MKTIIIVLLIVLLLYICYLFFFSVKLKLQTINFYSGGLGSGKTLTGTKTAIKLRNKSKLNYYLFSWNIGKMKRNKDRFIIRKIYSNYPIFIKNEKVKIRKKESREQYINRLLVKYDGRVARKNILNAKNKDKLPIFSYALRKGHILGTERLPEKVIVVIDECSEMFPNQTKKSEKEVTDAFRWFRHHTDGTLILMDQSIGDIDIAIRRRVNMVYNLSSFKKLFFFWYTIDVDRIKYAEDVITNINDINDFKTNRLVGFFGTRRFNSRYHSLFYRPNTINNEIWEQFKINPLED